MNFDSLSSRDAILMSNIISNLTNVTRDANNTLFALKVYELEHPSSTLPDTNTANENVKAVCALLKEKHELAIEQLLNVYDFICFCRHKGALSDLIWNELKDAVKDVYECYENKIMNEPAYDNIRWIFRH